jgi:hypothetical protein
LKIRERPPSTLRNVDDGPPGGARVGDLGVTTINVKNIEDGPPGSAGAEDPVVPTINAKKH